MKTNNKTLRVFEYQNLRVNDKINDLKFEEKHFKALSRYGYKTKQKYFTVGDKRITFCNYVGVIQVKGLTIEVLPKADKSKTDDKNSQSKWHDFLIDMLHVCKLIKLDSVSNARLRLKSASILDLYFEAFLDQVEYLYHNGLKKRYRRVEDNLNKVKGRIVFNKHIVKNIVHKEKFYVENKIYDWDNKLNQILKKAILILNRLTTNHKFISRIKNLLVSFEDIKEKNFSEKDFRRICFNRNTERYRYAIKLAELIILEYSPDLKGGRNDVLAILFDMNTLFEEYVYRIMRRELVDDDFNITRQNRKRFWGNKGMKPDIVVRKNNNDVVAVIDTKWKVLDSEKANPSDHDLRQVFTYSLYFETKKAILLYPQVDDFQEFKSGNYHPFKINEYEDSNRNCTLAFYDLFDPDNPTRLNKNLPYNIKTLIKN